MASLVGCINQEPRWDGMGEAAMFQLTRYTIVDKLHEGSETVIYRAIRDADQKPAIAVADTLAILHSQPIVHKDIKPHNIVRFISRR